MTPSSVQALQDLGVQAWLPKRGQLVCICHDPATGHVSCAAAPANVPDSAVNISYLACALRVLHDYGREPQFSLDPKDPHNISGDLQVKAFYPSWLAGTVVGEVLFQADYALKELCLGDRALPFIPDIFRDPSPSGGGEVAARQWFVVRRAEVLVAADGALVPRVQMGVDARRLVACAKGYEDAQYTDPSDGMVRVARAISDNFMKVAAEMPVVAELLAVARAIVVARYLLEHSCRRDKTVLERFALPTCPEGPEYSMEIPTLRNQQQTSVVEHGASGLRLHTLQRFMHGGVDLGVKDKKIRSSLQRKPLLRPNECRVALPLFMPLAAAAAA